MVSTVILLPKSEPTTIEIVWLVVMVVLVTPVTIQTNLKIATDREVGNGRDMWMGTSIIVDNNNMLILHVPNATGERSSNIGDTNKLKIRRKHVKVITI